MSQKTQILYLPKEAPNHTISCRKLAHLYLFHKAASRISDLKKEGYDIEYIPSKTDSPLDAFYKLKERTFYVQPMLDIENSIESYVGPR